MSLSYRFEHENGVVLPVDSLPPETPQFAAHPWMFTPSFVRKNYSTQQGKLVTSGFFRGAGQDAGPVLRKGERISAI
jgi:hypothetical protein